MSTKTFVEIDKVQTLTNKTLDDTCTVNRTIDDPNAVSRSIAAAAGDLPSIKDFGAVSGQDASVALQKAIDWLPSEGGMVLAPPGLFYFTTKVTPTKPVIIVGAGDTSTRMVKKATAFESLNHWLESEYSVGLYHLGIETETALDQNYQMNAVRLDLDGASSSFTKRRLHVENCRIDGFNIGLYGDGGAHYGLDFQTANGNVIKNSGPAADYIGSAIYGNRVTNLRYHQNDIDMNFTGEHGVYCFAPKQVMMDNITVRNATRTEAQSVKLVGNFPGPSAEFRQWTLYNIVSENCFHGILISLYNSETIHQISLRDIAFSGITGSANIYGPLAFYFTGTAKVDQINVDGARFASHRNQCIHFSGPVGARIDNVNLQNIRAHEWSTDQPGLDTLFGVSGLISVGQLNLRMVHADGNNKGRAVVHQNALSNFERVNFEDVEELNVTEPGYPVEFVDQDETPSVRIGLTFKVNNTVPTNLTRLDDMRPGKTYTLKFMNSFTTLVHSSVLVLKSGSNTATNSVTVKQFYTPDGVEAFEI